MQEHSVVDPVERVMELNSTNVSPAPLDFQPLSILFLCPAWCVVQRAWRRMWGHRDVLDVRHGALSAPGPYCTHILFLFFFLRFILLGPVW